MESEADLSLVERFMSFYFQSLINLTNNFRVSTFVFELSRIDSPKIFPPFPNIRIYIYVYIYAFPKHCIPRNILQNYLALIPESVTFQGWLNFIHLDS